MSNPNDASSASDSRRFKRIPVENLDPEQRRLYDAIRDGRLVARKWGRRTIVLRSDLEAFLQGLESAR